MDKRWPLEDYASHSTGYSPVWEFWVYHCLSTSHIRTYLSNLTLGMGDRFAFQQTKASLKPCYLSFLWNEWKSTKPHNYSSTTVLLYSSVHHTSPHLISIHLITPHMILFVCEASYSTFPVYSHLLRTYSISYLNWTPAFFCAVFMFACFATWLYVPLMRASL